MSEDPFRKRVAYKNTLVLFEMYWLQGMSIKQIAEEIGAASTTEVMQRLRVRGIPERTRADVMRYQDGDVDLTTLQWRYLSPFQRSLAYQLREDRIRNGGENHE